MEFTLKTKIKATAEAIYSAWLNSEGHSKMTGGLATTSAEVGARFTAWDGYIEGENLILEPYHRIVQAWRTTQFEAEEDDSEIELLLQETEGETELTLIHRKVPESGEHYKKGWENHYFQPMQAYFSK